MLGSPCFEKRPQGSPYFGKLPRGSPHFGKLPHGSPDFGKRPHGGLGAGNPSGAETDGWRYLTFTLRVLLLEATRFRVQGLGVPTI